MTRQNHDLCAGTIGALSLSLEGVRGCWGRAVTLQLAFPSCQPSAEAFHLGTSPNALSCWVSQAVPGGTQCAAGNRPRSVPSGSGSAGVTILP